MKQGRAQVVTAASRLRLLHLLLDRLGSPEIMDLVEVSGGSAD